MTNDELYFLPSQLETLNKNIERQNALLEKQNQILLGIAELLFSNSPIPLTDEAKKEAVIMGYSRAISSCYDRDVNFEMNRAREILNLEEEEAKKRMTLKK